MVGSPATSGAPFFTLSAQGAYGWSNSYFFGCWGMNSPSSSAYYNGIISGSCFTQITAISAITRDDVLAINSVVFPSYSGHLVIITGRATVISPPISPVFAGTTQWAVPIVDATTSVHGCSNSSYLDSRCPSGTGAGTGYMRLYSDTVTGQLLGYTWSVTSSSTSSYYAPSVRPYAIGRLTACLP